MIEQTKDKRKHGRRASEAVRGFGADAGARLPRPVTTIRFEAARESYCWITERPQRAAA